MSSDVRDGLEKATNPVKAIRLKCLDCCNGSHDEVRACAIEKCALWAFRLGRNPYRSKREMTPEQREAAAERLRKAREAKGQAA